MKKIEFPSKSEYPAYAEMYMKLIKKDGGLIGQLKENLNTTKELVAMRLATISLFNSFSEEALLRMGTANGNNTSVRALGCPILPEMSCTILRL